MVKLITGLIFSFAIALAALKKSSLSFSGFIGAIILGTSLYYFGDFYLSMIMICFFVSSSLLTKFREKDKSFLEDITEKGGKRDYVQVIANGGLGLLFSLLYFITDNSIFIIAYATAFAAANADTWASELGVLSKGAPVSILTFRKVEVGASGAISLLGTIFALCGSIFISMVFFIGYVYTFGLDSKVVYYFFLITIAGFLGSLLDSLLGASVQAKYRCSICNKSTEKKIHHGVQTLHVSGFKWMNNDVVNFISCLLSSTIALFTAYF